jgi:hypothetical protein
MNLSKRIYAGLETQLLFFERYRNSPRLHAHLFSGYRLPLGRHLTMVNEISLQILTGSLPLAATGVKNALSISF